MTDGAESSQVSEETAGAVLSQEEMDAMLSGAGDPAGVEPAEGGAGSDEPAGGGRAAGSGASDVAAEPADSVGAGEGPGGGDGPRETGAPGAPVSLPEFGGTETAAAANVHGIELLGDVELNVKIELGRCRMYVEDVLKLGEASVVGLDKLAGDPVDVFVNERLVARGEVLVLNDSFCVRISEILAPVGGEA